MSRWVGKDGYAGLHGDIEMPVLTEGPVRTCIGSLGIRSTLYPRRQPDEEKVARGAPF